MEDGSAEHPRRKNLRVEDSMNERIPKKLTDEDLELLMRRLACKLSEIEEGWRNSNSPVTDAVRVALLEVANAINRTLNDGY